MALTEDAVAVLEDFIHDASNLPAEIAHLLEEIQSKDKQMLECRQTIADRDTQIQGFIRRNGSLVTNPKEDELSAVVLASFDRAMALQDEKFALSDKASILLDRQIRRLDVRIRDLTRQGIMSNDPPLPSILVPPGGVDGIFSDFSSPNNTGVSTPLTAVNGNGGGPAGVNIANSNLARLGHANAASNRVVPLTSSTGQLGISNQAGRSSAGGASYFANSAPATPAVGGGGGGLQLHQRPQQRESSAGAADAKRRRLLGSIPTTSSALARHASLGPGTNGTSRGGTPSSARSGSAGPNKRTSGGSGGGGLNGNINKNAASSSAAQQQIRRKLGRPGQWTSSGRATSRGSTPASSSSAGPRKQSSSTTNRRNLLSSSTTDNNNNNNTGNDRIVRVGGIDGANDDEIPHRKYEDDEDDDAIVAGGGAGGRARGGGSTKVEDEEEEDDDLMDPDSDDKRLYCTCRNVSYGNMVACDNDDCPYEWFHWSCVGVTKEPVGKWFCGECRVKLGVTNS